MAKASSSKFAILVYSSCLLTLAMVSTSCTKGSKKKSSTFYTTELSAPSMLNPISSSDYYATKVQLYVTDRLLNKDPDTNEFIPGLAESWEVSPDGKKYTFKIRKDAKFSDGTPVTVEDVKFSYEAIKDPKFEAAHKLSYFQGIGTAEIVDENTIAFPVENKYFGNLETLGRMIQVVPKAIYEKQGKDNKLPTTLIGSGPYIVESFNKAKSITLKKNPEWWGFKSDNKALSDSYQFDKIVIRFIKEYTVGMETLKKGNLDYMTLTGEQYTKIVDTDKPEWSHITKETIDNKMYKPINFLAWNLKNPIFAGKKTRQALSHLMNRELMKEKFSYNKVDLATGPWYFQSIFADPNVKPFLFEPETAKRLLKEDGWQDSDKDGVLDKKVDGKKIDFKFTLALSNREMEKFFTLYKEDLKRVGVDMDIKNIDWNSFVKALNERNFEAVTLAWMAEEDDINVDPKQIWHTSSIEGTGSNFIGYSNKKVDQLIDKAREELDSKKRVPYLREVYRLIADDAPYAFMFVPQKMIAINKNVHRPKPSYVFSTGLKYWTLAQPTAM